MIYFTESKHGILLPWIEYFDHWLNILSYLETIFPKEFINQLNRYKIFLIKSNIDIAIKYLVDLHIDDITILDLSHERSCFEKTIYSKKGRIIVICNLNSDERIAHYMLLLQAASDISRKKIDYTILKNNDDNFFDAICCELIPLKSKIKKCIIGYWSEFEKILYKKYWLPTKRVRNNYFSYRFYENLNTIFIWHVFWWNSYLIVDILKKIWVKKFAYIWNCWGLWKLDIWMIVSPNVVIKIDYIDTIKNNNNLDIHISVPSPIIETNNFLQKIKKLGVSTIDVEYADLYHSIPKSKFYWYLIVSDLPWKINKNNARISNAKKFHAWLLKVVKILSKEFFNE